MSLLHLKELAARDPANIELQRAMLISNEKIGNALLALGDGPGALAAYRKSLAIAEALATRDPANTQWQTDLVVSCAKLGRHPTLGLDARRDYLHRGQAILQGIKDKDILLPSQVWTGWFEEELAKLQQ
jgi:hypothetical protein